MCLGVILAATVTLFILVALAIQSSPAVNPEHGHSVDQAESVQSLMHQAKVTLNRRFQRQTVTVTETQLQSLLGLVNRAFPALTTLATIDGTGAELDATYALPDNPVGRYINLHTRITPGQKLNIDKVQIGHLSIPGDWFLATLEWFINTWTDSDIATRGIELVQQVKLNQQRVYVVLDPIDPVLKQLNEIKHGLSPAQDDELRWRTAYYLNFLDNMQIAKVLQPVSLVRFTQPLFEEVRRRSRHHNAVQENEAAIIALAVFTGHHRLANLVGDIQPEKGKVALPRYRPLLAGRTDLTQHFVLSAAIHVLSRQGVSVAIGEFKELMDRAAGGSGYSFVDLAADMAGIQFATLATSPDYAIELQEMMASGIDETWFFPAVAGLPEGISKQQFELTFGKVDSEAYQRMVEDIHERLAVLPINQLENPCSMQTSEGDEEMCQAQSSF